MHRTTTRILSLAMLALGLAMVVRALTAGGGALAVGVIFGVLFIAAGAGRLWVTTRRS